MPDYFAGDPVPENAMHDKTVQVSAPRHYVSPCSRSDNFSFSLTSTSGSRDTPRIKLGLSLTQLSLHSNSEASRRLRPWDTASEVTFISKHI